jgi:hypothetical protein
MPLATHAQRRRRDALPLAAPLARVWGNPANQLTTGIEAACNAGAACAAASENVACATRRRL